MHIKYLNNLKAYSASYQGKILAAGINRIEVLTNALNRLKNLRQDTSDINLASVRKYHASIAQSTANAL